MAAWGSRCVSLRTSLYKEVISHRAGVCSALRIRYSHLCSQPYPPAVKSLLLFSRNFLQRKFSASRADIPEAYVLQVGPYTSQNSPWGLYWNIKYKN